MNDRRVSLPHAGCRAAGWLVSLAAACCLSACGGADTGPRNTGIYMLLDTSGTYTQEIEKAQQIIQYTLSRLNPGDSFAIARIDTGSFSEKDIVAKVTFDDRPSAANSQKRQFMESVNTFVKDVRPAPYTDITGGLLQALEFLNEKQPGHKTVFIFSDMKQDLRDGYVRDLELSFEDVSVIALNLTKLRSDNRDPREYLDRLSAWQQTVERSGGRWLVINDLDRLEKLVLVATNPASASGEAAVRNAGCLPACVLTLSDCGASLQTCYNSLHLPNAVRRALYPAIGRAATSVRPTKTLCKSTHSGELARTSQRSGGTLPERCSAA